MKLIARADANARVGAGHVIRCATLIEAWRAAGGGEATLAGHVDLPFVTALLSRLRIAERSSVDDASHAVLLVDTYDPVERTALARVPALYRVLVDDVGGAVPVGYDAVWHPHPCDGRHLYPGFAGVVISGVDAVPIRAGLPSWRAERHEQAIAVTLGGGALPADLVDVLRAVAAARSGVPFVAVGEWVPATWTRIDAGELWDRASRSACLITAAGTTVWEAAAVGIPVVVLQIADNQARVAAWAEESGAPVVRLTAARPVDPVQKVMAALRCARPLPHLADGAPHVASTLARLASAA